MILNMSKLMFFSLILEFIINLRAKLQKIVDKHQFNVIVSYFKQLWTITCSISPTCTSIALSCKICRLLLKIIWQHKLLGFVDQYIFKTFVNFPFTISNLIYSYEWLSLKTYTWHWSCPLDVLAPNYDDKNLKWQNRMIYNYMDETIFDLLQRP